MPVIAGYFGQHGPDGRDLVHAMVAAQGCASVPLSDVSAGGVHFSAGRGDRFSGQRGVFRRSGLLMAADVRLDNRCRLLELTGLSGSALSDARLLFEAYRIRGEAVVDHIEGDFAFAVAETSTGRLLLARDPTGQRPLHFRKTENCVAFASLPSGLRGAGKSYAKVDRATLAEFTADLPRRDRRSFFEGIERVLPGEIVELSSNAPRARGYFVLPTRLARFAKDEDYVTALREHIDHAVKTRLIGAGPRIGCQLSGGLDSASVTATCAMALGPDARITAFTAAPREGFEGAAPAGRISDECEQAASLVQFFASIDHETVRTRSHSIETLLMQDADFYDEPMGHVCNQLWWEEIHRRANHLKLGVLLTGEAGNLAFSAGSVNTLSDFLPAGAPWALAREMLLLKRSGVNWRGALVAAFGPWMPKVMHALSRPKAPLSHLGDSPPYLAPGWKLELEGRLGDRRGGAAARNDREARWNCLIPSDPGCFRKRTYLRWQLEERDPTADRRLLEFCFAIPPEQLIRFGITRSLARRAMADRLPDEILQGPRGYQAADWYEGFTGSAAMRLARGTATSTVVDGQSLLRIARNLPSGGFAEPEVIAKVRLGMLRALSAASFERAAL